MQLPVFPDSDCYFEQGNSLDLRIGSLAIDKDGLPWITAFHNEAKPRTTFLWHYNGKKWDSQNLLEVIQQKYPEYELLYCGLTFDRGRMMYMPAVVQDVEASTHWGDPSQEVIFLYSSDFGHTFQITPVSEIDPDLPNWLINIERPYSPKRTGVPSLLYTHGNPGTTVSDGDATEVIFMRFEK